MCFFIYTMSQVINPVKKQKLLEKLYIFYVFLKSKMKLSKSTYFAFFFLFCFLASFSANTYRSINTSVTKFSIKHSKTITVSSKEENAAVDNEFLFEETENETENDFQAQSFILPFFVTYFQYEKLNAVTFVENSVAEKLSNPIYISVCNFRI